MSTATERGYDRRSVGFGGNQDRILQPEGTPKEREWCQAFTFKVYDEEFDQAHGNWRFQESLGMRVKVAKSLEYLGPWCSRCGKKGVNCKAGNAACSKRRVSRAFRGTDVKALKGSSLPRPTTAWIAAKYGSRATEYHSGGRTRQDKSGRIRLPNYVEIQDAAIMYAYEVATGKWSDEEAMAA